MQRGVTFMYGVSHYDGEGRFMASREVIIVNDPESPIIYLPWLDSCNAREVYIYYDTERERKRATKNNLIAEQYFRIARAH